MNIALDYDNTYTADPALWAQFIALAKARGHDIRIVTARSAAEKGDLETIPVIYCDRVSKRRIAAAVGFHVDIWIDDRPQAVDNPGG